MVEGVKKMFGR